MIIRPPRRPRLQRLQRRQYIDRNTQMILNERRAGVQTWFYIRFYESKGAAFQGCIFTLAYGITEAVTRSMELGLTPEGTFDGLECPTDLLPPPEYRERMLTDAELQTATGEPFAQFLEDEDNA